MRPTREANRAAVARYKARHTELVLARDRARAKVYRESDHGRVARAAHFRVLRAVRDGRLQRTPCQVCAAPKVQGHHHRGYEFPLDVIWLCALHHKEAHRA